MYKKFLIILILAFINLSCSHYYPVSREDIIEEKRDEKVKLILWNGKKIVGERFSFNVNGIDTSIVIIQKSNTKEYLLDEVDKFYINEKDYIGSVLSLIWISLGVIFIVGIVALSGI